MFQLLLYQTNAWDATKEHILTFRVDGEQIFKNRLVIRNNTTNAIVYDKTQTTMQLKHIIAPNSLQNGVCYNAELQVFNKTNIASSMSNRIIFYCYTTPTLRFTNIVSNQIITKSNYTPTLEYAQPEGELLNEFKVILYNSHHQNIYETGVLFASDLKAYISGLEDNQQYFIRSIGTTLNGMDVDTGYIPFSVEYVQPSVFAIVSLENNPIQKNIKIQSNIIPIEGIVTPKPAIYINGKAIDLTADGSSVIFNDGFCIEKDTTFEFKVANLKDTQCFLYGKEGNKKIELFYRKGKFNNDVVEKVYMWLKVTDRKSIYIGSSIPIEVPLQNELLHITLRRINNLYDVSMINTKEVV